MSPSKVASEKKYTMIDERDVMVPMRDNVKVAVDVFRPDDGGKFPALLAMSPYGKGIQSMTIPAQPQESPIHHTHPSKPAAPNTSPPAVMFTLSPMCAVLAGQRVNIAAGCLSRKLRTVMI